MRTSAAASGWSKTYGGPGSERAYAITATADGGYVLAGATNSFGAGGYDFWLLKTDASGNPQWNRTYGWERDDVAVSLAATLDGGYILAGYCNYTDGGAVKPSIGTNHDDEVLVWVVKTDAFGIMYWNKTYGIDNYNVVYNIVTASDGGYAFCGSGAHFFGADYLRNCDWAGWVQKIDALGSMQWSKILKTTPGYLNIEEAFSMITTADGDFVVAARWGWDMNFRLIKLRVDGFEVWNTTAFNGGGPNAYSLSQTSDGGYVLLGKTGFHDQVKLAKTDADGKAQWNQTYQLPGCLNSAPTTVIAVSDGSFLFAAYSGNSNVAYLTKTDASGNKQWERNSGDYIGYSYPSRIYGAIEDTSGGYILAGYTQSDASGTITDEALLFKTDEYGVVPEIPAFLILTAVLAVVAPFAFAKKRLLRNIG